MDLFPHSLAHPSRHVTQATWSCIVMSSGLVFCTVAIIFLKCNFPMDRSVRQSVSRLVGQSVVWQKAVKLHFHAPIAVLVFVIFSNS